MPELVEEVQAGQIQSTVMIVQQSLTCLENMGGLVVTRFPFNQHSSEFNAIDVDDGSQAMGKTACTMIAISIGIVAMKSDSLTCFADDFGKSHVSTCIQTGTCWMDAWARRVLSGLDQDGPIVGTLCGVPEMLEVFCGRSMFNLNPTQPAAWSDEFDELKRVFQNTHVHEIVNGPVETIGKHICWHYQKTRCSRVFYVLLIGGKSSICLPLAAEDWFWYDSHEAGLEAHGQSISLRGVSFLHVLRGILRLGEGDARPYTCDSEATVYCFESTMAKMWQLRNAAKNTPSANSPISGHAPPAIVPACANPSSVQANTSPISGVAGATVDHVQLLVLVPLMSNVKLHSHARSLRLSQSSCSPFAFQICLHAHMY